MTIRLQTLVFFLLVSCSTQTSEQLVSQNAEDFDIFSQEFVHPEFEDTDGQLTNFEATNYPFNELDSKATEIPNCVCGAQTLKKTFSATPWIEGGIEAEVNEFPWVVALIYRHEFPNGTIRKQHFCGGTLINNRFVLTAQHCLIGIDVKSTEVWLNEHDILLSTETVGETLKRQVIRFIPHPNYNKFMHYNDLALMELEDEVDITDGRLRSICLPFTAEARPTRAVTAGWGQIGFQGPKSDKLLKVDLPIISKFECINSTVPYYRHRVTENSICAGDLRNGKRDTCPGDSGGGLFNRKQDGNFVLLGICSFGVRCGEIGKPGVYVKVSKYLKWIEHESRTGRQCKS